MSEEFVLNEDNYYTSEANERYMSFHTYLQYAGHGMITPCEARAVAIAKGEWVEPVTDAMLVGSYVDSYFDNSLDKFKTEHPEIFTQKGELRSQYKRAERMIARCEKDPFFMKFMSGEKQTIMTGYWAGCDWKIKMDSYIEHNAIVDLKTASDIHRAYSIPGVGTLDFTDCYFYIGQLALYQKIVEINTGEKLECYIAVVTKEDEPEIAVIDFDQETLDNALTEIEENLPSVLMVRNGEAQPTRCEHCNFCKATRKLSGTTYYRDLIAQ